MTNGEKYKTAHERAEAFEQFCQSFTNCNGCKLACKGAFDSLRYFAWLDLEAEDEKPLPCVYCKGEVKCHRIKEGDVCICSECGASAPIQPTKELAIEMYNRIAKKCMEEVK